MPIPTTSVGSTKNPLVRSAGRPPPTTMVPALVAGQRDVALHPVALAGVDERAADRAGVGRVPGGQLGQRGGGAVDGVVEVPARDDQTGRDGTALPGVHAHREGGHPARAAQIGVVEHHEGRLPAELEEHPLERARRVAPSPCARWRSTR